MFGTQFVSNLLAAAILLQRRGSCSSDARGTCRRRPRFARVGVPAQAGSACWAAGGGPMRRVEGFHFIAGGKAISSGTKIFLYPAAVIGCALLQFPFEYVESIGRTATLVGLVGSRRGAKYSCFPDLP